MKKQLTAEQFAACIQNLDVSPQTIEIARGVLVEGHRQSKYVAEFNLTKGAVSQAVTRIWEGAQLPGGFERVTAVLPERQAFIVRQWAAEAAKKREPKP